MSYSQVPLAPASYEDPAKKLLWRKRVWFWSWVFLFIVAANLAIIYFGGDKWWWGTIALYAPRWLVALPLLALLPVAYWYNRRAFVPLLLAGLLVAGPICSVNIPPLWGAGKPGTNSIRVLTYNTQHLSLNESRFNRLLIQYAPDVVVLQEFQVTKNFKELFPEKTWKTHIFQGGVVVASKHPISQPSELPAEQMLANGYAGRVEVNSPIGKFILADVHLPTPREGLESLKSLKLSALGEIDRNIASRQAASMRVRQWLSDVELPLIVAGDFNLPSDSHIYQDVWGNLSDAFEKKGWGYGYTKHTRWYGLRIDHVLSSSHWRTLKCFVADDCGSDHQPVLADLYLVGP